MKVKNLVNILIALILISLVFLIFFYSDTQQAIQEEVEKIKESNQQSEIVLKNIKEGDIIKSPLVIQGEVKGTWFSEGSFPVILTDGDGLIIAEADTSVNSNWLTDDYVNFEVYLEFETPEVYTKNGHLIFQNANSLNSTSSQSFYEITVNFE